MQRYYSSIWTASGPDWSWNGLLLRDSDETWLFRYHFAGKTRSEKTFPADTPELQVRALLDEVVENLLEPRGALAVRLDFETDDLIELTGHLSDDTLTLA